MSSPADFRVRLQQRGQYNRFRYYDPEIGRYISADPIGQDGVLARTGVFDPGDFVQTAALPSTDATITANGSNLFGYVSNNPVNSFDLLGLYDGMDDELAAACKSSIPECAEPCEGVNDAICERKTRSCVDTLAATGAGMVGSIGGGPSRTRPIGKVATETIESTARMARESRALIGDVIGGLLTFFGPDPEGGDDSCDTCP